MDYIERSSRACILDGDEYEQKNNRNYIKHNNYNNFSNNWIYMHE